MTRYCVFPCPRPSIPDKEKSHPHGRGPRVVSLVRPANLPNWPLPKDGYYQSMTPRVLQSHLYTSLHVALALLLDHTALRTEAKPRHVLRGCSRIRRLQFTRIFNKKPSHSGALQFHAKPLPACTRFPSALRIQSEPANPPAGSGDKVLAWHPSTLLSSASLPRRALATDHIRRLILLKGGIEYYKPESVPP